MTDLYYQTKTVSIYAGDCRKVLPGIDPVDAVVCDPPYGLSFMGKGWDRGVPGVEFWEEIAGAMKPGAHLLAFGGTRTFHRLACAIEDAGLEIRDCLMWVYGTGFPKSLDVSKAIDKAAGTLELREFKCKNPADRPYTHTVGATSTGWQSPPRPDKTHPATDAAKQWEGWGTALKPAWEPIILARKPLIGTVAANVLEHGTGCLNIDGCRVGMMTEKEVARSGRSTDGMFAKGGLDWKTEKREPKGRWPANLLHDGSDEVLERLGDAARFFYQAELGDEEWLDRNLPQLTASSAADPSSLSNVADAIAQRAVATGALLEGKTCAVSKARSTSVTASESRRPSPNCRSATNSCPTRGKRPWQTGNSFAMGLARKDYPSL